MERIFNWRFRKKVASLPQRIVCQMELCVGLRFLTILLNPNPAPVTCLDEPELGLHPDAIHTLADLLVEASTRTQLIVTTHSDALLDAFTDTPDVVCVCEKVEGSTVIRRLDKEQLKRLAQGLFAWASLDERRDRGKSLVSVQVYVEGGGNNKDTLKRCNEGFASYCRRLAPANRSPGIVACGGANGI